MELRLYLTLMNLFTAAILHLLPEFRRSDRLFGVTLSPQYLHSHPARRILARYEMRLLPASVATVVAPLLAPIAVAPLLSAALILTLVAVSLILFNSGWKEVRHHAVPSPPIRTAPLTPDGPQMRRLLLLAIPAFVLFGVTALYLNAHWNEIPQRFPVHWGANSQPNRWSEKTVLDVYRPLFIGSGIDAWMMVILVATYRGARNTTQRFVAGVNLVGASYISAVVFSTVAMFPLHVLPAWTLLLAVFVPLPVLLVWSYRRTKFGTSETTPEGKWMAPGMYYNASDAAMFVERKIGFGYTVNLANPRGIVIALGLLVSFGLLLRLLL